MKATITAEYAATLAQIKMKKASEEAEKAKKNAEDYSERVLELDSKASKLEMSFTRLKNKGSELDKSISEYVTDLRLAKIIINKVEEQVENLNKIANSTQFKSTNADYIASWKNTNEEYYLNPGTPDVLIEDGGNIEPYVNQETIENLLGKQSIIKTETQKVRDKFAKNSEYFVTFVLLPGVSSGGSSPFSRRMPLTQKADSLTLMMEDQIGKEGFPTNVIEDPFDVVNVLKPLLPEDQKKLDNNVVVIYHESDKAIADLVINTLNEKRKIINLENIPTNITDERQILICIPYNRNIQFEN